MLRNPAAVEHGVGEAAGARYQPPYLVDDGTGTARIGGATAASRASNSAIIASPRSTSPTAATVRDAARTPSKSLAAARSRPVCPSRSQQVDGRRRRRPAMVSTRSGSRASTSSAVPRIVTRPRASSGIADTAGSAARWRDGGDARAADQLDQQLVGAQVERDDAAWCAAHPQAHRPPTRTQRPRARCRPRPPQPAHRHLPSSLLSPTPRMRLPS